MLFPFRTLEELARWYQTDKGSLSPRYIQQLSGHDYCNLHYQEMFSEVRFEPIKLLEIGINKGSSLRMWRTYFPNGQIYGLDNRKETMVTNLDRVITFCGNQQDKSLLEKIAAEHGPFDYVIDDGCHIASAQWATYQSLKDHVERAYIIEDVWDIEEYEGQVLMQNMQVVLDQLVYRNKGGWHKIELWHHFLVFYKKKGVKAPKEISISEWNVNG